MFESLLALDNQIFHLINQSQHTPILDWIFLFFSFYPLLIWTGIGVVVGFIEERHNSLFFLRLILALVLAGALSSVFIKPIVRRPRPDIQHGAIVVLVPENPALVAFNNDFAFPSGHAAVAFAGAYIVTRGELNKKLKHTNRYRKVAKYFFYVVAAITAFSRIYLGKHYPLDVIAGALLGIGVGWVSWWGIDELDKRVRPRTRSILKHSKNN